MRNFHLAIIIVIFTWSNLADGKSTRTNQSLKKAHLKPTKEPKNVLDKFKTLPPDDFEFIKQLDKQFSKFGDNVKIKLQKVNRTSTKNIKRTIDGSLGYGYQNPNDHQSTYTFSKPKYEVYPYSQHDIPPTPDYHSQQNQLHYLRHYPTAVVDSNPNYYHKQAGVHTSVEVQPSHSYEIKQTEHGYKTIYHGSDGQSHQQYGHGDAHTGETVPVILLRIPGPAKYVAHLRTLLTQYLEARAAQFVQILQQHAAHGIDSAKQFLNIEQPGVNSYDIQQPETHGVDSPLQSHHEPELDINAYALQQHQALGFDSVQQIHHGQEPDINAYALQHQEPHEIDNPPQIEHGHDINAYAGLPMLPYAAHQAYLPAQMYIHPVSQIHPYYEQSSSPYANAHIAQPIEIDDDHSGATPSSNSYYNHGSAQSSDETDQHSGVVHPTGYQYHNIHDDHSHHAYSAGHESKDDVVYGQQESVSQQNELLTNENYPDDKHTRVIFKTSTEAAYTSDHHDHHDHYEHEQHPQPYLPPTQVNTYRAPLVYHMMIISHDDDGSAGYDDNAQPIVSSTPYASTVSITQRPAVLPHNYHAQLAGQLGSQYSQHNDGQDDSSYDYSSSTEASDEYLYKRNSNKKRQSIQSRENQYKKFTNLANRMKSRINSEQAQA